MNRPIGGYESTSERPYRIAVTTQDVHQHLTETTRFKPIEIEPYQNQQPEYYPTELIPSSVPVTTFAPIANNSIIETITPLPVQTVRIPLRNLNVTSLTLLLNRLKEKNHLPPSFDAGNVDNSIRTLAKLLNNLKRTKKLKPHLPKPVVHHNDYDEHDDGRYDEGEREKPHAGTSIARFDILHFLQIAHLSSAKR